MATWNEVYVDFTPWDSLWFRWSLTSQSAANNTSTISWTLELHSGSDGRIDSTTSKSYVVTINGYKYSGTNTVGIANNSNKTLATGTAVIGHNADGSKAFTYSFAQEFNITFDGEFISIVSSPSYSDELPELPKASQPSLVTWPETTNDVGDFGEEFSIHMNRKSSAFTHTVRYEYGTRSGTIATGVTTGTTWAVPLSFMNDIPNATSASGRIYVDTYDGSTKIGTKYTGFTVTVPASVVPTCTVQVLDATDIQKTYGNLVKGLSKLYVKVNGYPAYSSPIVSRSATANDDRYTSAEFTTGVLKAAGTTTITATVTDKRGRASAAASASFPVLDYALPSISLLTVRRCNADGTENEQGEHVRVVFSATITALNNKNTAAYKLRYKKSKDTEFTQITLGALANVYSITDAAYIFEADSNSSYDVELEAQDNHGTTTRSTSASTAFTLMNWGADGTSMGIGKVAEKENTLQIALDVEFIGKVRGAIFDAVYPVGSIYFAYNHTNPSTLFGGTWTRLSGGFLWASQAGDTIGQTGGAKEVTLTIDQIPAHTHGSVYSGNVTGTKTHSWLASGGSSMAYGTVSTGGGAAHNNMPPYIQVSIWRRTA